MIDLDIGRRPELHEIARLQQSLAEEKRLREVAERALELMRDELARVLAERDALRRTLDEVTGPDARTRLWMEAALANMSGGGR